MKTFLLVVCVSALSLVNIRSENACCESKAATVQARLQEIDLNCQIAKYEALKNAQAKAEVQLALLEAEATSENASERHTLQRRAEVLAMRAKEVRQEIEAMSKSMAVAAK